MNTKQLGSFVLVFLFVSVNMSAANNPPQTNSFTTSQTEIIGFTENLLLSTDDSNWENHVEPTLSINNDDNICVGWKNADTDTGGGMRVSFARSMDNGDTWSSPINMPMFRFIMLSASNSFIPSTDANTRQSDPWIIWREDAIYYAYLEFSLESPDNSQITISKSVDNGVVWIPKRAALPQDFADKETMVISDNGTIFVAYDDVGDQLTTMKLTRSTDNGEFFSHVCNIGIPDEGNLAPYVTLNNQGELFVVSSIFFEAGGNINLYRSSSENMAFSSPQLVNNDGNYSEFTTVNGAPGKGTIPIIRFDQNDRLYILWSDMMSGSFDIYFRYSDDYGVTWSNRNQVNPTTTGDQWQPDMDIDSEGNLHIVYYDEQGSSFKPYYRKVSISGEERETVNFDDVIPIATENTSSSFTRPGDYFTVRVDSNDIPHVVWTDGRNGDALDIYYAKGYLPETETTTTGTSPTTTSTTYQLDNVLISVAAGLIAGISVISVIALFAYRFNRR